MNFFRIRNGFIDLSRVICFYFDDDEKCLHFVFDITDLEIVISYDNNDNFYDLDKERLKNIYMKDCEDYL